MWTKAVVQNQELVRPETADWLEFLAVAGEEGWRVPVTELNLFRGPLADSALVLRCEGRFAGLVTFVNHDASAWIGNLIVRADLRGRGLGKLLFEQALERLAKNRAVSVWLTASEAGFPLYQRREFETVGRVERWILEAGRAGQSTGPDSGGKGEFRGGVEENWRLADARSWGGRRPLLDYLLPAGQLFSCGRSMTLVQREPGRRILGPWYSCGASAAEHRRLLAEISAAARPGEEVVADVLAGSITSLLLEEAGFVRSGVTRLMVRGATEAIRLESLVSLASLGSIG